MTAAELLLEDFDAEVAATRRTLERIPEETPDWKPHDKSMAMGRLSMHVASLPVFGKYILTEPGMDMKTTKLQHVDFTWKDREHLLVTFDMAAAQLREALAAASDEELAANWRFSFGDRVISDRSRAYTYRVMFFNHMLHHRAQLGVYLRLNGVPVPGIYGPSADEPFAAGK